MQKRKAPAKRTTRDETPLDLRQKAVEEQQKKLQMQMEKYQRLIEEAPRLAQERDKKLREQFVTRAARTEQRGRPRAALPDRRYELNAAAPARQRRLRAERNQGRLMFFILLLVFGAVVTWVYLTMVHA